MVVWFAHVRVGHRQALNTKSPSILDAGAFLLAFWKHDQLHNSSRPKKLTFIKDRPTRTKRRAGTETLISPQMFSLRPYTRQSGETMSKKLQAVLASALILPVSAVAGLDPISDAEMSEVTGQAFLSVDRSYHPDASKNTAYTRVNLGMDIEIQTSVDVLEIGRYERDGEKSGTSDVLIENFGLGYINNQQFFDANPEATRQVKPDGSAYAEGEIVPFHISNPFFEFAFDETTNEVIGVRLGFGDSMGILSGDIRNLTGDVNIDITATGRDLEIANSNGDLIDGVLVSLAPLLLGSNAIQSKAVLVHGEGPNIGEPDPVRATYAGVPNGERFTVENVSGAIITVINAASGLGGSSQVETSATCFLGLCGRGDVSFIAQDCQVLGINACFPPDQLQEPSGGHYYRKWRRKSFIRPSERFVSGFPVPGSRVAGRCIKNGSAGRRLHSNHPRRLYEYPERCG